MKRRYFRSIIFNLCFYGLTALLCVVCLPMLLAPRRMFMGVVSLFVHLTAFLERWVLGLRYEIRGAENIPNNGSYIVAAKHQSAYETTKLHILFKDPAVILKKELLAIPLWGWFLKKSDVIAIDRSSRESAVQSINDGAERMKLQSRPIVIFPQGTRVAPDTTTDAKPYKVGVARLQDATELSIVPLAMNSGLFWPRNGFFKSGGTVIFEFLKPIKPGMERDLLMKKLEKELEDKSNALMDEARANADKPKKTRWSIGVFILMLLIVAGYCAYWFQAASFVKDAYIDELQTLTLGHKRSYTEPVMSGFPFKITLSVEEESVPSDEGVVQFENLIASSLPLPYMPINIQTDAISFRAQGWSEPLSFDSFAADIAYKGDTLTLHDSLLKGEDFSGEVQGTIDFSQKPIPKLDIVVTLTNHQTLLNKLAEIGVIESRIALFLGSGMNAMKDPNTGLLSLPIHQKGDTLMAGPLPVMKLPITQRNPRRERPAILPSPLPSPGSSSQDSDSLPAQAQ